MKPQQKCEQVEQLNARITEALSGWSDMNTTELGDALLAVAYLTAKINIILQTPTE